MVEAIQRFKRLFRDSCWIPDQNNNRFYYRLFQPLLKRRRVSARRCVSKIPSSWKSLSCRPNQPSNRPAPLPSPSLETSQVMYHHPSLQNLAIVSLCDIIMALSSCLCIFHQPIDVYQDKYCIAASRCCGADSLLRSCWLLYCSCLHIDLRVFEVINTYLYRFCRRKTSLWRSHYCPGFRVGLISPCWRSG